MSEGIIVASPLCHIILENETRWKDENVKENHEDVKDDEIFPRNRAANNGRLCTHHKFCISRRVTIKDLEHCSE
jgi:hypothetical protein